VIRLNIKQIAKARGISQRKLSLRSGVDIKTVQKIYRHPTTIVTTETLDKLSKVLNVDASLLIASIPPLAKDIVIEEQADSDEEDAE